MGNKDAPIDTLALEIRRGAIVLAVLSQLHEPEYGYSLQQRLAEQGLDIEQGTLYPLLRRLQEQGFLSDEWRVEEPRPRKYYRLTEAGANALRLLSEQWRDINNVLNQLLESGGSKTTARSPK